MAMPSNDITSVGDHFVHHPQEPCSQTSSRR